MKTLLSVISASFLFLAAAPAPAADDAAKDAAKEETGMKGNKPNIMRTQGRHAHGSGGGGEHKGEHRHRKDRDADDKKQDGK